MAVKRIDGFLFKATKKLKYIAAITSELIVGSDSSSNETLSQLSDSNDVDDDIFDEYVDKDVVEKELRSWVHHSPIYGELVCLEKSTLLVVNQRLVVAPISTVWVVVVI